MKIFEYIDVVLITYNRAKYFEATLNAILGTDSPIRNCHITILDNRSTDNTREIAERFAALHPNLEYRVNRFNVGGNANIAHAIEMYGDKPYHWVICDDDKYDWTGWSDVESAMECGEKVICVGDYHLAKDEARRNDPAEQLQQMTFLPSIIYGPGVIGDTVMRNVYDCTFALFPHLAPIITHLNHGGKIYTARRGIVIPGCYGNDGSLTRGDTKTEVFTRSRTSFLAVGFAILTGELWDRHLARRAFRALAFGSQMGAVGFYGQIFLHLRGKAGSANFHAIWMQCGLREKCVLLPLRVIQNSFLYPLLTSQRLYAMVRRLADRISGKARSELSK